MIRRLSVALALGASFVSFLAPASRAQQTPLRGIRREVPRWHAFIGATVIPAPGERIEDATIVVRDGVIQSVESGGAVPEGARVWDYTDLVIHPGFVEACAEVGVNGLDVEATGRHWQNQLVVPERSALDGAWVGDDGAKRLRGMGFTSALLVPDSGVLRGRAGLVTLGGYGDDATNDSWSVIARDVFDTLAFDRAGWGADGALRYPTSEMGAIALARQTLLDADHHARCLEIAAKDPSGRESIQPELALEALAESDRALLFVARNELQLLRAARLAGEFGRRLVAVGTGTEFRRLDAIADLGVPLIVPLAFPDAPDVSTLADQERQSLRALASWEQAPTNPRRLRDAGVDFALTASRMDSAKDFEENVRLALEHGLSEEDALRALTVTPARLVGAEDRLGRIAPGYLAHLVVRKGEPFAKDGKIRDVWVAGERFRVNRADDPDVDGVYSIDGAPFGLEGAAELVVKGRKSVELNAGDTKAKGQKVRFGPRNAHLHFAGAALGQDGVLSVSLLFDPIAKTVHGSVALADGSATFFSGERTGDVPKDQKTKDEDEEGESKSDEPAEEPEETAEAEAEEGPEAQVEILEEVAASPEEGDTVLPVATDEETDDPTDTTDAPEGHDAAQEEDDSETDAGDGERAASDVPEEIALPFGAFGRLAEPMPRTAILTGATVWTADEAGILENAVVVIDGGKIAYVGPAEGAPSPEGAETIDCTGKHITPGLIDCHSHTGIAGGVNEVGRRVTAEVRINDVIDPDDIAFYHQLAGGLTAANQLHGSANAIGGQNSVVKLRWGAAHPDDLRVAGAKPGIKFALGENPKRVAAGVDDPSEYPQTRMGVEALIHDRLLAGRDHLAAVERYDALGPWEKRRAMPPRRDLELEAMAEIVGGERLIHCHSYRQDEILMLARLAQAFGFKIGTFQHVLEGYKVAQEVKESALGASTFADWWAYKFEVIDAIPHNAALMTNVGVVVSINSDSDEHARRLNTEAAKAMKYGELTPEEAIKLVTLNPAIQLGLGDRMGSLCAGKDADLAIWSGDPLSYRSRCLSTWIDGAEYWSEELDAELAAKAESERQRIIQKLLARDVKADKKGEDGPRGGRRRGPRDSEFAALQSEWEELWRSGNDPSLARPGVCGCFDVFWERAAVRAQGE